MAGARALLRKTVGSLHLMHLTTNDSKEKPRMLYAPGLRCTL